MSTTHAAPFRVSVSGRVGFTFTTGYTSVLIWSPYHLSANSGAGFQLVIASKYTLTVGPRYGGPEGHDTQAGSHTYYGLNVTSTAGRSQAHTSLDFTVACLSMCISLRPLTNMFRPSSQVKPHAMPLQRSSALARDPRTQGPRDVVDEDVSGSDNKAKTKTKAKGQTQERTQELTCNLEPYLCKTTCMQNCDKWTYGSGVQEFARRRCKEACEEAF